MRRLHPATIVVALLPKLREAIQTAMPIIIGTLYAGRGEGNHEWIAVLIGSFTGIFAIGAYWTTRFDIEPNHVVHTSGWIFRKDRRIPLEQIQNVNIRQNILERIFRVATVDVETAMGHGRDLKLSVLGYAEAERFREQLLGAAHLEQGVRPKADEPIVSLNRHDLLLGAVTENHFAQMIAGMFTIVGPGLGLVLKFAAKLPPSAAVAVFAGGLVVLTLASWLWGVVSYYLKFGGFTVHRQASIFRISYGLLNRVQMAIRHNRIEYLRLTVTLPQRWMERATLQVGTAGSFGEAGVLAPVALFVDRHRAYAGISEVFPGLDIAALKWEPFHPVFYRARIIRGLITIAVAAAAAAAAVQLSGPGAIVLACVLFGLVASVAILRMAGTLLARAENGFALTGDALVVRQGYYHQFISAMPIARMENMAVSQPMWWQKYSAVTLTVQAMKHRIHVGAIPNAALATLTTHWREVIDTEESRKLYAALAEPVDPNAEPASAVPEEDFPNDEESLLPQAE